MIQQRKKMRRMTKHNDLIISLNPKQKIVIDAMIQNDCSEDEMLFVLYQSNPAWDYGCDRISQDPAEIYAKYMEHRRTIQDYLKTA